MRVCEAAEARDQPRMARRLFPFEIKVNVSRAQYFTRSDGYMTCVSAGALAKVDSRRAVN